jgi:NADH:ubiquinone oxidoreductase subunit E
MEVVGWHLGIPASEVYGAATSYTELLTVQPGRHVVQVCTGISCSINGGGRVLEMLQTSLGIESGETTADGRITLDETACAFMCGVAPAVRFDHEWQGRATVKSVNGLLRGSEES